MSRVTTPAPFSFTLSCAAIPGCHLDSLLPWPFCTHSGSLPGHSIHGGRSYLFTMPMHSCYSSDCNPFLSVETRILHMAYVPPKHQPYSHPTPLSPWLSGPGPLQFLECAVLSSSRPFFGLYYNSYCCHLCVQKAHLLLASSNITSFASLWRHSPHPPTSDDSPSHTLRKPRLFPQNTYSDLQLCTDLIQSTSYPGCGHPDSRGTSFHVQDCISSIYHSAW